MDTTLKLSRTELLELYRQMQLIRVFEEEAGRQYMRGKIRGFLHLYIGEEAIAVGAISALAPDDYVFTHYRDHGHALAKGMDAKIAMAELFGKVTGSSKGKGGSMHLFDSSIGLMGGYAIVAGQIPLAVGAAFGEKYKGSERIVVCFMGDGALNEGEFHEALNLAAIWSLPIVFYCENNFYGMGSPVSEVFAVKEIYRIAEPYDIPSRQVDGMDVLAVNNCMREALHHVRGGGGPYFIEALAYRFRGHSIADPSEYRDKSEEARWRARDPIPNFRQWLVAEISATEDELNEIDAAIESIISTAVEFAEESPIPSADELYEDIIA